MGSRLIGDFLEINADIVQQRETSKGPKFLSKIRASYFHRKLRKSIIKLKNSGYVLTKDNLSEFFAYTYNNYPPYGKYKSVLTSKINNEEGTQTEAIIKFDDCKAVITIDQEAVGFDISISIKKTDEYTESFIITTEKLYSDNKKTKDTLKLLNEKILEDLTDYILSVIESYR